jgi:hypothetical protein
MPVEQRLAVAALVIGGIFGALVLAAAWGTGHPRKVPFWLAGTAWGILSGVLVLTDCLHSGGPGPVSNAAFPIYIAGLLGFPVAMAWRQPQWYLRWIFAQLILLLSLLPAFAAVVASALCSFT